MAKPPPVQMPPQTRGTIDRIPCPHCGKPNDFRGCYETLQTGNVFTCDHCKQPMQIVSIKDVKLVTVRKPGAGTAVAPRGRR